MARLIDADALIDFLDVGHLRHPSELCFSEVDVANLLLHAPTISPDEVRGVGYNKLNEYPTLFQCSVCGWDDDDTTTGSGETNTYNYCPNCGAKMEVSEDG